MPFRAKFNYQDGPDGQPRPYLSLLLGKGWPPQRPVLGLIDSGSDLSSLPYGFAAVLGLDQSDLEPEPRLQSGQRSAEAPMPARYRSISPILGQLPGAPELTFELHPLFDQGVTTSASSQLDEKPSRMGMPS